MDFLFPGVVDSSLSFPFGRIELNLQKIALLCTNIIHRLEVVLFPWEHLVLRNPHSKLTRLGTPQKMFGWPRLERPKRMRNGKVVSTLIIRGHFDVTLQNVEK
jgi:hypothetical protein